jgi:hypothetical protein
MAMTPTEIGFEFGANVLASQKGPAILFLEDTLDSDGARRRWRLRYHWVQTDRDCALIYMAIRLIRALWTNARRRYLHPEERGVYVDLFDGPRFAEVIRSGDSGVEWTDMSISLRYWVEADPT